MNGRKIIPALGTTVKQEALSAISSLYRPPWLHGERGDKDVYDAILRYSDGPILPGTIKDAVTAYIVGLSIKEYKRFKREIINQNKG